MAAATLPAANRTHGGMTTNAFSTFLHVSVVERQRPRQRAARREARDACRARTEGAAGDGNP
jgi:hypothetical protein